MCASYGAALLIVLTDICCAALPPGYEDVAWCPPGFCLRNVDVGPMVGPAGARKECFDQVSGAVADEVWTGSRSNALAPDGWIQVFSSIDESVPPLVCPEGGPYGLPSLPTQFETWVTCNIVNKNYTVVVHEVYDAPNNRALFQRYHADHADTETTLYLYELGEYFHFNQTACNGGPLSDDKRGAPAMGSDGRIAGTAEFMRFASEGMEEAYLGIVDVAGVPCEHYRSVTDSAAGSHMELDYYFSAPGWTVPETHAARVPVLLNLTGSYPRGPGGATHHYHHYYTFSHFRVGPDATPDRLFVVPRGLQGKCAGNVTAATVPYAAAPPPTCDDVGSARAGLGGGAVAALCLLCAAVGVGATLLGSRWRNSRASFPIVKQILSSPSGGVEAAQAGGGRA